jgi:hypothetical protein
MAEFTTIFAVGAILWTAFLLYAAHLDSRVRALERKVSGGEGEKGEGNP